MVKKTFIPNWYMDKKNNIRDKKIKIGIMIVLIINIFLIGLTVKNYNKTIIIEEQLPSGDNRVEKTTNQDIVTIEKYKQVSDFFEKNNLTYKTIIITNSSLEIDIEVNSYKDYIYVIRCLEDKYSIKKLTEAIKNGDNFSFKVILGV